MRAISLLSKLILLLLTVAAAVLLVVGLLLPAAAGSTQLVRWAETSMFDVPPLPDSLAPPAERSVIYAADGSVLATLHGVENRRLVDFDDIPQVVIDAVTATEDRNFFEHRGVDHLAIVRAGLTNVQAGEVAGGGSTITQQLVKMIVLSPEVSLDRKITEAIYAAELEERWTKQEILTAYLNEAYFGRGVYGIETAAEFYFGAAAAELAADQAAMLAGLLRAPERNSPVNDPDAALARRNIVIGQMYDAGHLSAAERDRARDRPLGVDITPLAAPEEPFFVEWVKQQLFDDVRLGDDRQQRAAAVLRGGLEIHTTLEPQLQEMAEAALSGWLRDPEHDPMGSLVSIRPESGAVAALALGPKTFGECSQDEIDELGFCPRTQVNPAVAGGGGSGRQVGSAFKPFVNAAAIERGIPISFSTSTSSGERIPGCRDGTDDWFPTNYAGGGGGVRDMSWAATVSNNVYHAKLAGLVGPNRIAQTALQLGVTSERMGEIAELDDEDARAFCSISLGSVDAYPLDVTAAYAAFANDGVACEPYAITEVRDRTGEEVFANDPICNPALDPAVAAEVNKLLQGPTGPGGTATAAALDRPHAGKTGTTNDWRDAWFVGYTPQLATGAWVGFEQPEAMRNISIGGTAWNSVTGGTVPARMWRDFMVPALEGVEAREFSPPRPAATARVPDVRGLTLAEATEALTVADLRVETDRRASWRAGGFVYDQSHAAGGSVNYGSTVTLTIADGSLPPPEMVDVVGEDRAAAVAALREAGWQVTVERLWTAQPDRDDTVASQSPRAGATPGGNTGLTATLQVFEHLGAQPSPDSGEDGGGLTEDDDDGTENGDVASGTNESGDGGSGDAAGNGAGDDGSGDAGGDAGVVG